MADIQLSDFIMSTFIIGSRINPIFPDVKPSSIIGINGAIELIEKKYSDFNNVTMVCSPHIFLNDFNKLKNLYKDQDIDINYLDSVGKKILSKKLNGIIIRPLSDPQHYQEIRNNFIDENIIKKNCKNYLNYSYRCYERFILNSFQTNYLNFLIKELLYEKSINYKDLIRSLFNKNFFILKPFKISTGFLGLMTAINNPLFNPPYYVIGIGIDDSKYENKKSRIALRHNHLYADFKYLKKISKTNSIAEKIYFTDDNLNNKFNNLKK